MQKAKYLCADLNVADIFSTKANRVGCRRRKNEAHLKMPKRQASINNHRHYLKLRYSF